MIQVGLRVGRLLEVRTVAPFTTEEMAVFARQLMQALNYTPDRLVGVIDLRGAGLASPEQSELFSAMLRRDNPLVERTAMLLSSGSAMLTLQVERLMREANHPARKTFREIEPLCAYLDGILTEPEQVRLRAFLAGK